MQRVILMMCDSGWKTCHKISQFVEFFHWYPTNRYLEPPTCKNSTENSIWIICKVTSLIMINEKYNFKRVFSPKTTQYKSEEIPTKLLINSYIVSRLDYCKGIYANLPKYQTNRLQSVFNALTRLIIGDSKYWRISEHLRNLYCLKCPERIQHNCAGWCLNS